MRLLYRSQQNKIFAGILGGVGEYFNVDPVFIRLIFVALTLVTGVVPGIITYVTALFIVPMQSDVTKVIDVETTEENP
jgi:phage shock protein C